MKSLFVVLAQVEAGDLLDAQRTVSPSSQFSQWLIMIGGVLVATLIGGIWAIYYSKKKKKNRKARGPRPIQIESDDKPLTFRINEPRPPGEGGERRRVRRSRHPQRQMNPTLAQTRGLPPMRDKDAPLPPMP